jgi:hypothetical protein
LIVLGTYKKNFFKKNVITLITLAQSLHINTTILIIVMFVNLALAIL